MDSDTKVCWAEKWPPTNEKGEGDEKKILYDLHAFNERHLH